MTDRLTLTEAAELIGRHRNTLRGWVRSHRLTSARLEGGAWTVDRSELEALAPTKQAEPAAPPQGFELVPIGTTETLHRLLGIAAAYAETGERVGRAEAMAETYRERLAEARQELDQLRSERDRLADAIAGGKPEPLVELVPVRTGELVSRVSGLFRRIRR